MVHAALCGVGDGTVDKCADLVAQQMHRKHTRGVVERRKRGARVGEETSRTVPGTSSLISAGVPVWVMRPESMNAMRVQRSASSM